MMNNSFGMDPQDLLQLLTQEGDVAPRMYAPNPGPLPTPDMQVEDAPAPRLFGSGGPARSILDHLAMGIAQAGPMPTPRGSQGSQIAQGLAGGFLQGMSRARMAKMLDEQMTQETLRKNQAARNQRAIAENDARRADVKANAVDIRKRRRELEDYEQKKGIDQRYAKPLPTAQEKAEAAAMEAAARERATLGVRKSFGIDVTGRSSAGQYGAATPGDASAIADAIVNGTQPPDMTGMYRYGAPVRAELSRRGYDLTTAQADWRATQRWLSSANGPQQMRLRQAAQTAYESLDVVDELSGELTRLIPRSQVPIINKGSIAAAKSGAFGVRAQQVATNLDAQITDIVSELGNVYMGGNSPTDHSLELAAKNLASNWSASQLRAATELARTNLRIRLNSISNSGVISPSNPVGATGGSGVNIGGRALGGQTDLPPGYEMRDGIPVRVRK